MLLELRKLNVPPEHQLLLKDLNWQEFEAILQELGESRSARLSYSNGTLEIMTPSRFTQPQIAANGYLVELSIAKVPSSPSN